MLVLRLTSQGLNPGLAQERVIRAINNRIIKNLNNSSTLADESPPNTQKRGRDTSNCSDRQPTKKKAQVALLPPRGNKQAPGDLIVNNGSIPEDNSVLEDDSILEDDSDNVSTKTVRVATKATKPPKPPSYTVALSNILDKTTMSQMHAKLVQNLTGLPVRITRSAKQEVISTLKLEKQALALTSSYFSHLRAQNSTRVYALRTHRISAFSPPSESQQSQKTWKSKSCQRNSGAMGRIGKERLRSVELRLPVAASLDRVASLRLFSHHLLHQLLLSPTAKNSCTVKILSPPNCPRARASGLLLFQPSSTSNPLPPQTPLLPNFSHLPPSSTLNFFRLQTSNFPSQSKFDRLQFLPTSFWESPRPSEMEAFPVETIVEIMRQCDSIGDLLALASTCERFQSTFDKFSPSILQHLKAPGIPDFDDALVVVRATAIVKDSYAKGVLPPKPFPFDQLAHGKSPATLIEYQKVANLIEFLKLIEAEFAHLWRKYLPYIKDDLDDLRRSWEGAFNDSMLKALLMNAVLAGEMAEPFWNAGQKLSDPSDTGAKILQSIEDPGSRHLGGSWQRDESGMTWVTRDHYAEVKDWLNDEDIQYLEIYTAYRNDRFTGLSKDLSNTTFGKLAKHFRLENKSADCFLPRVFQTTLRDLQDYAFFERPDDQENLPYFQSRFNSDSPIKQMVVAILHLGPLLPGKLTRLSPEAHAGRRTVDFVPFGCFNVHTYAFDAVEGDYWEPEFFWGQVGGISLLKAHKPHGVDSGGKFADLTDILSFHRGDLDYIFEKNDEKYNSGYDRRRQAEADWDTRWNRIRCDGDMDW